MTAVKPDVVALLETLEVVQRAIKVGLWEQAAWINPEPIASGKLEWQGKEFCGTAGCFAGWRAMLDGGMVLHRDDLEVVDGYTNAILEFPDGTQIPACSVGSWARDRLGLTIPQAEALFAGDHDLSDLEELVSQMVAAAITAEPMPEADKVGAEER